MRVTVLMFAVSIFSASLNAQEQDPPPTLIEQGLAVIEDGLNEPPPTTIVDKRMQLEEKNLSNPLAITQHRLNYVLPYSHISNPNQIGNTQESTGAIDNNEAKYQISVKMPIYVQDDLNGGLVFGFTAVSFWQIYNNDISKPFRETNYEPEIFYNWRSDFHLLGYRFNAMQLGINHQSNGQSQLRSRSWNRLFGSVLFSDYDSFYFIKAWYRIKEDEKLDPLDAIGDDNPDITHFLGHFEFGYGAAFGKFKLFTRIRNNLKSSDNKGSIELNLSYPLNDKYEVLLQYFNGYGDSLIDYNRHQQRFGLGVQLSFL